MRLVQIARLLQNVPPLGVGEHLAETLDVGVLLVHDRRHVVGLRAVYPDEHLLQPGESVPGHLIRRRIMARPRGFEPQVVHVLRTRECRVQMRETELRRESVLDVEQPFLLRLFQNVDGRHHALDGVVPITDGLCDLLQTDPIRPALPVPVGREPGLRIGVPFLRTVDVLEADEGASPLPVRNEVDGNLVERPPDLAVDLRNGDAGALGGRDPSHQNRFPQQKQRGEPPVAFQDDESVIVAVALAHHDQRLDVEVPVGGDRLQQLVELGRAVEARNDPLVGCLGCLAVQPRVRPVQPQPLDRDLRGRLKLHRHPATHPRSPLTPTRRQRRASSRRAARAPAGIRRRSP